MIDKGRIAELVGEKLDENLFLVDISVSAGNAIHIEIDSLARLTIDECVAISRHIESQLDRDAEDFELQVSSPGADQPFKVVKQYRKNVGRTLEVTTQSGEVLTGKLTQVGESEISVEISAKEIPEGEKKKRWVTREVTLLFDEIKKARVVISFK